MSTRLKFFISTISIATMGVFLLNVQVYTKVFLDGVTIWANNVLPTILPFMILSSVATKSGGIQTLCANEKLSRRIFGTPNGTGWIYLLSLLCGYPIGAKLIAEQRDCLDKSDCIKLATYCTTASPIFIFGTIGNTLLHSTKCALVILISHVTASLLNGITYKSFWQTNTSYSQINIDEKPITSITDAVNSILTVGALIALFYTLCAMISDLLPRWFSTDGIVLTSFALGLLEITTGCINLASITNTFNATVLCCALTSFGGLCVIMQMMTFLSTCKIKTSTIVLTKATHCAFSTIICFMLAKLFSI